MPLFSLDDLVSYLPDSASNPARAELIAELTEAVVYAEVPSVVADASLVAKAVGLEVAARAYRNAEGYSFESVDDYSYRRDSGTRAAGVYLTGDERAQLQKLTATPRARVRSVKLRRSPL